MSNSLLNSSQRMRDSLHSSDNKIIVVESSPQQTKDERQDQRCFICCQKNRVPGRFFSACQHNGSCIRCAQKHMKESISKKKYPTCMIDPNCDAKMIISHLSLFQYFKQQGKAKWRQYLKNKGAPRFPPCKVPNCPGVIDRLRCLKCDKQYCQNCEQFSHPFNQKCKKPIQALINGIKQCPNCSQSYMRDSGCQHITCLSCNYEFCEACKGSWNAFHHGCFGQILSRQSGSVTTVTITQTSKKKRTGCTGQFCLIF